MAKVQTNISAKKHVAKTVKKAKSVKSVKPVKTTKTLNTSLTKKLTKKTSRSEHCIIVCGKDRCVDACGPVSGTCIPCPICHHGHFCENDYTCLSCGATRGLKIKPYKGA